MNIYWIWFSMLNKIGAKTQNDLLKEYKTPEKIWSLNEKQLKNKLTDEQINIVLNKIYRKNLEKYSKYMQDNDIKMVTIKDKNYPKKLLNIFDPPVVLYIKGNERILNDFSIAVVGSRMCSDYGKKVAKEFAYNLAKNNINIISGLAKGIDRFAHIGAIQTQKPTIAVVGNGLNMVYPKDNIDIYQNIIKTGGAIITEYIVGTEPKKEHFPARNRIISGLSNGVLIVEAGVKSGSLITADFALEYGKNVYAVPRKHI